MPENAKYVGRPTKWGNPFRLTVDGFIQCYSTNRKILDPWIMWSYSNGFETKDIVELYGLWIKGELKEKAPYLPTPPNIEELKTKMILKGESAEEFNRKSDENYEKYKARQKQNLIDMMEADEELGLYTPKKLYTIEDIERCVENWGLCKVEKEYIEKFLGTDQNKDEKNNTY